MPAKNKLARRMEPRFGVSQNMLDVESKYVGREVEDYCVYSITDLKQMLAERQAQWLKADGTLQVQFEALPEREHLVMQCLVVRDIYHLLELYVMYVRAASPGASGSVPAEPEPCVEGVKAEERPIPFSEWLFARTDD